jgi:molybdopterin-binding protein
MKLSTRNIIKGKVTEIQEGMVIGKVKVDIGGGNKLTSTITVEAIKDLGIKVGDEVSVLIKASSVMLGKD